MSAGEISTRIERGRSPFCYWLLPSAYPFLEDVLFRGDVQRGMRVSSLLTQSQAVVCDSHEQLPAQFQEHVASHRQGQLFNDGRWAQAMQQAYGTRVFYLCARRGDRTVGTLALTLQKSLLLGARLCSLPYLDASGLLADDSAACAALLDRARLLMKEHGAGIVELRQQEVLEASLPMRTDKVTLKMPIGPAPQQLLDGLKGPQRRNIRKVTADTSMRLLTGGADLLEDFYRVYLRNMRDLGSPPHSLRYFEVLLDLFAQAARLFVIRRGDLPLAAAVSFPHGGQLHVPWVASDRRFKKDLANSLLYWRMFCYCCQERIGTFDFGRSTRGSGTYVFKQRWGAREIPLYWHYLLADGVAPPGIAQDSLPFRVAEACWRRLPLPVAAALGPRIICKLS